MFNDVPSHQQMKKKKTKTKTKTKTTTTTTTTTTKPPTLAILALLGLMPVSRPAEQIISHSFLIFSFCSLYRER